MSKFYARIMHFRVALAFGVLISSTQLFASSVGQPRTLLEFVHDLALHEPLSDKKLKAILPTELNQIRTYDRSNREDYESRDIRLADGSVELFEFRQTGQESITIVNIRDGCLYVDDIKKYFKFNDIITPNRTDIPNGVYRQSVERWGKISFEFVDSSKCARTVVLNAGLD